ncbi:MAG: hypothetical protein H6Q51_1983 [Deltaproteobacteria bacterium]|nr:hypothetical protein [Deltaproteobacteria bacterium]
MYLLPDGTSNLRNFDSAPLKGQALLSSINGATTPWRSGRVEEIPLPPTQSRLEAAPRSNGPRGPLPGASCPLLAAFP